MLNDSVQQLQGTSSSIVFVSRKHLKNANDKGSHFERVMDNEASLNVVLGGKSAL